MKTFHQGEYRSIALANVENILLHAFFGTKHDTHRQIALVFTQLTRTPRDLHTPDIVRLCRLIQPLFGLEVASVDRAVEKFIEVGSREAPTALDWATYHPEITLYEFYIFLHVQQS